jgi:flagellar assembly protein FliH
MTNSSDRRNAPRQVPPPQGGSTAKPAYNRFIPREELGDGFSSWTPGALGGMNAGMSGRAAQPEPREPAGPTAEEIAQQVHAARQTGYHDGYRDGLVALDGFKQSYAQQMTAQVGQLLQSFEGQFDALEQQMAHAVAQAAVALARQVVRAELQQRPELVAQVAQDAVNAVLLSARHIHVHVNPQDQALVADGAFEALQARGARLIANPAIQRGGCLIESDAGSIDARIESRWAQAAAAMGQAEAGWNDEAAE